MIRIKKAGVFTLLFLVLLLIHFPVRAAKEYSGTLEITCDNRQVLTCSTVATDYGDMAVVESGEQIDQRTYQVFYDEDVREVDAKQGDLAAEVTAGEDGIAVVTDLPSATYKVIETGVEESQARVIRGISVKSTDKAVTRISFSDPLMSVKLIFEARDQTILSTKASDGVLEHEIGLKPAEESAYGVFTSKSMDVYLNGNRESKLPQDTLVGILELENGYSESTLSLIQGEYYVRQIRARDGFMLSDERYPVRVIPRENGADYINVTDTPPEHEIKFGSLEITKVDPETGLVLPGCSIKLMDGRNNIFYEGETDEDGILRVDGIPYGHYYYCESSVPAGFRKDRLPKKFDILEDGVTVQACTVSDGYTVTAKGAEKAASIREFYRKPTLKRFYLTFIRGKNPLFGKKVPLMTGAIIILFSIAGYMITSRSLHRRVLHYISDLTHSFTENARDTVSGLKSRLSRDDGESAPI